MRRIELLSLVLLGSSILTFLSSFYYHQKVFQHDYRYAEIISSVTSMLSNSQKTEGAIMSLPRGVVTEEWGILVALGFSVAFALTAVVLSMISWRRYGRKSFHLPISFAGSLIALWIPYMAHSMGLLAHV